MNRHALERLEWGTVLEQLAARAQLDEARERLRALGPDPRADWLHERQALFDAVATSSVRRLALAGAHDLRPFVEDAGKGMRLEPEALLAIARTIARGQAMTEALREADRPVLTAHFGRFGAPLALARDIGLAIDDEGAVRDTASPALNDIRRRMVTTRREIDAIFDRIMQAPAWAPYLQENLVTIRNGRRVVPVKHAHRHQVPGVVHDQSGSGQTVFVEPMAVVERQNLLVELAGDEAAEIDRILRRLSQAVAAAADTLVGLSGSLAGLEELLAAARWADAQGAVLPQLGGDILELDAARHPLLADPVPLSLTVGGSRPVLVITGPNTGGKTVALKCTGLVVALALAGLPVPARSARVPIYRDLLADIGDEQSLEQSLSTFSGHLAQLVPMVEAAGPETLLLVDEIGAGTDPDEGSALAVALIEHLRARGATLLVTTHFARVKVLAYQDPGLENAHVEFDPETLSPTYRLVMGQAGSSQALHMAERLGLRAEVLERARALRGQDPLRVEEALTRVNELERSLRRQEAELARAEVALERARAELERMRREGEARRREEWERARRGWQETVAEFRRQADAVLSQARAAGRAEREQALEALRREMRRWGEVEPPRPSGEESGAGDRSPAGAGPIRPGMWVLGHLLAEPGQVLGVEGPMATVEAGTLRLKVPVAELRPASGPPAPRRARAERRPVAPAVSLECDLRGMTALEAVDEVDRYLDRALAAGLPLVRIVHGKGTGALRRAVQEYLRDHPAVLDFRLGEAAEGGDGATVVHLSGGA